MMGLVRHGKKHSKLAGTQCTTTVFKGRHDWIGLLQTGDTKHFPFPIRILVVQAWPELTTMCGLGSSAYGRNQGRARGRTEVHEVELGKDRWTRCPDTSVNTPQ